MKIAVIGAGLAGLGVTWHLLQRGCEVHLYDPKGVAGGASGVSTGLLHPFPGRRALRSWKAEEGIEATQELLQVAEEALQTPVSMAKGVFRPALFSFQKQDFAQRAAKDPAAQWETFTLEGKFLEGLWIPSGVTVFSRLYLQGLWQACAKKGASLKKRRVETIDSLSSYDQIILAAGWESSAFFPALPMKPVIGQVLLARVPRPPFAIVSQGYLTQTEDPSLCHLGSTYEHTPLPDPSKRAEILDKVAPFYPLVLEAEIVDQAWGCRAARSEGYRPIVQKMGPKTWVVTALGSRGTLYHALLGKKIAHAIFHQHETIDF